MSRPITASHYKTALGLDVIGALAICSYSAMSFFGPVPFWAQVAYLGGAIAAGASALILRNWFSLMCFGVVIACAVPQVVSAT